MSDRLNDLGRSGCRIALPLLAVMLSVGLAPEKLLAADAAYDPLTVPKIDAAKPVLLEVLDEGRNRTIPIKIYLPQREAPAAVVLFSHGLGGAREGNPYLGRHWAARGYVAVFLQHPGSDESVWKELPPGRRLTAMKAAANLENTVARFRDVSVVLDQLERWQRDEKSPLHGRLNLDQIGMSGHSFGAVTTQGVSGQQTPRGAAPFTDRRIKGALAMSPNAPKNGGDPNKLFSGVAIPWLLMTGTNDTALVGDATVESRLAVYPALPPGNKYELVLKGGEHEAFGDRDLPGTKSKRNPNHHRAILAISTAFWDAHLRGDKPARDWLDGDGPKSVLEPGDRWQKK
jgi:dienelactone hydrolase